MTGSGKYDYRASYKRTWVINIDPILDAIFLAALLLALGPFLGN